ncbi:biogenesis of lysosome-related organelles complex 1 subunit 1-like [Tenrec ecaudatus]|uniref:biogenesis of lysosome-related organelles complex 1 subunit 1-like n=1 Tax=Tenrec ecaudatus TaxID=94439 RepID=UPI003F59CA02
MLLYSLLKEHQAKQVSARKRWGDRQPPAHTLVDHLDVLGPSLREPEEAEPGEGPARQDISFAKKTGPWMGMMEQFNPALKEIRDGENWPQSIELDMRTIATALEYAHQGQLHTDPA